MKPSMRILVADDEAIQRKLLEATLRRFSYEVTAVSDGNEALHVLEQPGAPQIAVLDWNMPGLEGPQICEHVRTRAGLYTYMILLTARNGTDHVVAGLKAGADDFVSKPFNPEELLARIHVGERIITLESTLATKVKELEAAQAQVGQLEGLLPICMHCHKVRNEAAQWQQIEAYVEQRSSTRFSHGLCEACLVERYPDEA